MQRNTGNTESVTVEYGFLDSKGDDVNQLKNNWENLAEGVVRAVTKYAGIPYIENSFDDNDIYTVKSGDSLWNNDKKFNTTVTDLKTINNLSSNLLSIGQVLNIPNVNNDTITYTVKNGDTLYKIANNYNTTVSDIMKLNNLSSNLLSIGQVLIIPNNNIDTVTYTVKSGDTLYKIANNYNTTVSDIINKNNLKSTVLSIGQILIV